MGKFGFLGGRWNSIRVRLSLLAIAWVPLLALGLMGDREVTQRLETEIQTRLEEVAASRVREFETHFRSLQTAVGASAQSPTVRELLSVPDRNRWQQLLSVYTESVPYQDATLLEPIVSDFDRDRQTGEVSLYVSAPVLAPQGLVGAVALRVSNRTLARLASQCTNAWSPATCCCCTRTVFPKPRTKPENFTV